MYTKRGGGQAGLLAVLMASSALGGFLATPVAAQVQAQAQAERVAAYDVGAQSLGSALAAFSRTSGVDIIYGAGVPNIRSPGVSGD